MVSLCCYRWIWIPFIVLSMFAIVESKKPRKRIPRFSHRNHQDLASNHIMARKKRSSHVNTFEETTTTTVQILPLIDNKRTLVDLEEPALFNDFDRSSDLEESTNETHIRVKRTNPDFDESNNPRSFMRFDDNYLEDLADSFPRRPSSDEQHWSFKKRHIGLSKRSNDNDISAYRNLSLNSNVTSYPNITEKKYYLNRDINDSMISNIPYNDDEVKNGTNFSETSNPLDSAPNIAKYRLYKRRIKRERKPNKNIRRRILHGKKRKLKKHAGKKDNKKKKGVSSKRAGKRLSNSSKMASAPKDERRDRTIRNDLPNVIDDYPVESRIEKRDSNDARSEVDVAKREISNDEKESNLGEIAKNEEGAAVDNEAARDKRNVIIPKKRETSSRISQTNFKRDDSRSKRNGSNDLTIAKYPNESTASSISISAGNEIQIADEKPRGDRAVKSIEDIRELAEKLVTKVNELQNYLGYENERENRRGTKKKIESREIEVPRESNGTRVEEEVVLETPQLVDECVRIGELSSALKTLDDRNVSLERSTSGMEVATERINLASDRAAGPSKKRMVRKSRIKRKSRRKWGRWTGWSSCSVTCGKGRQIRWRHCLRDCSTVETEMEEKTCQLPACPPGKFLGIF